MQFASTKLYQIYGLVGIHQKKDKAFDGVALNRLITQHQDKKPSPQLQTWLKSRLIARETIRLLGLL